jgi:AbrB family looped-hinge helix DNA binding protein
MRTTIDRFGRVIIPKPIRDDLGLGPGSVLRVEEHGEGVILTPLREDPPLLVKDGVLVFSGSALVDITGALQTHRKERLERLSGRRKE